MHSPNTGSSTGVSVWEPQTPPTGLSFPLALRPEQSWGRESQSLEGMVTYPILAVALQIHFFVNLTLYTKRKVHLQRIRAKLSKARGH